MFDWTAFLDPDTHQLLPDGTYGELGLTTINVSGTDTKFIVFPTEAPIDTTDEDSVFIHAIVKYSRNGIIDGYVPQVLQLGKKYSWWDNSSIPGYVCVPGKWEHLEYPCVANNDPNHFLVKMDDLDDITSASSLYSYIRREVRFILYKLDKNHKEFNDYSDLTAYAELAKLPTVTDLEGTEKKIIENLYKELTGSVDNNVLNVGYVWDPYGPDTGLFCNHSRIADIYGTNTIVRFKEVYDNYDAIRALEDGDTLTAIEY